jgi:hypothetical protein
VVGKEAAGHKQERSPEETVVTTARSRIATDDPTDKGSVAAEEPREDCAGAGGRESIDYAALRRAVSMRAVLEQLGWLDVLRGSGPQRRGPCPIHDRQERRHQTFSVHLDKGVFQCFHAKCTAHGNVLDLWSQVVGLPLYEAAQDLAQTLGIALPLLGGTEKRNP